MVDRESLNPNHITRVETFSATNASVLEMLTQGILKRFGSPPLSERRIVGIAGPGCVGKSTLAEVLTGMLRLRFGYNCDFLDLDGYLIEKAQRESSNPIVSGYNPNGYELHKARMLLESWLNTGGPLKVKVYDKLTSKRTSYRKIQARDLLIIEGVFAFYKGMKQLSSFRIFVKASKEVQYFNRWQREKLDLGLSEEQIKQKFQTLYPDYEKYILPTLTEADVILNVRSGYKLLYEIG